MKKIFIILFIFLFTTSSIAIDSNIFNYSGTYIGQQCLKKCKDSSAVDELIEKIPLLKVFQSKIKPGLLLVEHDTVNNKITVISPSFNYAFTDMKLINDVFEGIATNVSNTTNTIKGKIIKGKIDATITKGSSGSKHNIVGILTARDTAYNQLIIDFEILQKQKTDLDKKLNKQINDLSKELNKQINDLSKELKNSKKQGENQDNKIKELNEQIIKLENEIVELNKQIKIIKGKPPKINVSPLSMTDKITGDGVNLRSVNSDNGKKYLTLNKGHKVRLLSIADGTWALIVTKEGIIGYVLSAYVNSADDGAPTQPKKQGPNEINVLVPCKITKSGQACNLAASGIVTIQGNINTNKFNAIEVLINDEVADFDNDGNFEIILFDIKSGIYPITVSALDSSGKIKELSFDLISPL